MSEYRNRTTGEVKTQGHWRAANPNMSLPRVWKQATLDALDLDPVLASPKPAVGQYQTVRRNGVTQDAKGNWVEAYEVVDMFSDYTDQEGVLHTKAEREAAYQADLDAKVAEANRKTRDDLLAATDWVVIMHTEKGTNIPADMEVYRQALRDITSHANWPNLDQADWPTKP
jgi:hypothetical protein